MRPRKARIAQISKPASRTTIALSAIVFPLFGPIVYKLGFCRYRYLPEHRRLDTFAALAVAESPNAIFVRDVLVETTSSMTGSARRLLDAKLQETGDQLARLEARLVEVQGRLAFLADTELETQWVARCLADFDKVWDALTPENTD